MWTITPKRPLHLHQEQDTSLLWPLLPFYFLSFYKDHFSNVLRWHSQCFMTTFINTHTMLSDAQLTWNIVDVTFLPGYVMDLWACSVFSPTRPDKQPRLAGSRCTSTGLHVLWHHPLVFMSGTVFQQPRGGSQGGVLPFSSAQALRYILRLSERLLVLEVKDVQSRRWAAQPSSQMLLLIKLQVESEGLNNHEEFSSSVPAHFCWTSSWRWGTAEERGAAFLLRREAL